MASASGESAPGERRAKPLREDRHAFGEFRGDGAIPRGAGAAMCVGGRRQIVHSLAVTFRVVQMGTQAGAQICRVGVGWVFDPGQPGATQNGAQFARWRAQEWPDNADIAGLADRCHAGHAGGAGMGRLAHEHGFGLVAKMVA